MIGLIRAFAFLAVILAASGCAAEGTTVEKQGEVTEASAPTSTSTTAAEEPELELSPDRFGNFPDEPSDQWILADPYEGTSFVNLKTGDELDTTTVDIRFGGRRNGGVSAGGCTIASGTFDLIDGQLSNIQLGGMEAMWCDPTDQAVYDSALALVEEEPEIRVDGDRLLLLSPTYRLELLAAGPGVVPVLYDTERFIGIASTVPGIEPDRLRIDSPAFFVIHAVLPSCEIWGGTTAFEGDISNFGMEPTATFNPCENAPEPDKIIEAFLGAGFKATRNADILQLTNEHGSLTLELQTR